MSYLTILPFHSLNTNSAKETNSLITLNELKSKLLSLKVKTDKNMIIKYNFFKLQESLRKQSLYCFYDFIFDFKYTKYSFFSKLLIEKLYFLKFSKLVNNMMISSYPLKICYIRFLNQKKIFMQYIYESYFLKFFCFKNFLEDNTIEKQEKPVNLKLFRISTLLNLRKSKTPLELYPFLNIFLNNIVSKLQSEKLLQIFSTLFITSHTLKFYFQELNFLEKTVFTKLINVKNLNKKIKLSGKVSENLTKNSFILNYWAELQSERSNKITYFGFKKQQKKDWLFFKFHRCMLDFIIPILQLKIGQIFLKNPNLQSVHSTAFNLNPMNFKTFKKNSLNYASKSVLLILNFLFFKTLSYANFSLITLNTFYQNNNLDTFVKKSKKEDSSFIEFLKHGYGKTNSFLNKKQTLFLLKVQKKSLKFENKFQELLSRKIFLEDLSFTYKQVKILPKSGSIILMHVETSSFSAFNINLNEFESFFLKIFDNKQFNIKVSVSKQVKDKFFETYVFNKIFNISYSFFKKSFLLRNFQSNDMQYYFRFFKCQNSSMILKYNSKTFLKTITMYKKISNILDFLDLFFLSKINTVVKTNFFAELSADSLTQFLYLEKTKSELLIVTSQKLKICKFLNLLTSIEVWFFYEGKLLNSKTDIYFYTFSLDENKERSLYNHLSRVNNLLRLNFYQDKKFIFLYKNSLIIFLKCHQILELPIKWEQEKYIRSLKKILKNYSNKNQNVIITDLTEKVYLWSYNSRFSKVKNYFFQLDQQLFEALWKWGIRRHNNKSKNWIQMKYFYQINQKSLLFAMYINSKKSFNKLDQVPRFIYIPFHLQLFLIFKKKLGD